jgi:hypothetical protein
MCRGFNGVNKLGMSKTWNGMEWNIEYSMENRNYGMEYMEKNYGKIIHVWYNLKKENQVNSYGKKVYLFIF